MTKNPTPKAARGPKPPKGQLVRLTTRDYQMLLELYRMAMHERGGQDPASWPDWDEMMAERWDVIWRIKCAVYPKKSAPATMIPHPSNMPGCIEDVPQPV